MRAMILAAGLGTRLRPLTETLPKPILEVCGRPLIHYPLLLLKRNGIREVVINLHHQGNAIPQALGNGHSLGLSISYSYEPEILGTGGGIKKVEAFFQGRTFLVINADTIMDIELEQVVNHHKRKRAAATMVLKEVTDWEEYGAVEVDDALRVRRIRGLPKAEPSTPLRPLVFTGLHILEPEILANIPPGESEGSSGYASIIQHGYIPLIEQNRLVSAFITNRLWLTVDTPEKLAQAEAKLSEGHENLFG